MNALLLPLAVPFVTALVCLALGRRLALASWVSVAGCALLVVCSLWLAVTVDAAEYLVLQVGGWQAPFGITLVADRFSLLMLVISSVIALSVAVYARKDIPEDMLVRHYHSLVHFLLLGVNGAFLTGDLFNLFVCFEVMLLSSFVLITMGGKREQLEGGVKYLVINLLSSILFLCAVGLLYGKVGTLNMADIAQRLSATPEAVLVNSSAMLLLASFGIKAAIFPFFFWLPASYHTPPTAVSALFAGLLTKVGVYAMFRAYTLIFHSQFELVQNILVFLAAMTMVTGVLGAASQYDIRKILSFHIVSQIGYLMMGLAIGSMMALAGALYYMVHNILAKSNLFLIGGVIAHRTGSSQLKKIGGLYLAAPKLAVIFLITALSLGGIPPLSGFWAKYSLVVPGLEGGHYWLVATALLVGVMTLYSMTKIWAEAFWKTPPEPLPTPTKVPWALTVPCVVLMLLTLMIGLFPEPLMAYCVAAAKQLADPQSYIDAVLVPAAQLKQP
jgi:multicomponent Na+:H+ antiporter subunit D